MACIVLYAFKHILTEVAMSALKDRESGEELICYLSVYLSVSLSICLSGCLSDFVSVRLSACRGRVGNEQVLAVAASTLSLPNRLAESRY